jgi:hypothetical protein
MSAGLTVMDVPSELSVFEPVLARLQAEAVAHFGTAETRLVPLAVEQRPFSQLLRVGVCRNGAVAPDVYLFVKVFKPKPEDGGVEKMRARVAHDFDVSRRIYAALDSPGHGGAVRPVACYVEHLAIISEEAQGPTLMAHLNARARWFPTRRSQQLAIDTLAAVGRWLRAFQTIEPGTGVIDLGDLRRYIDVRLQRLVSHAVWGGAQRDLVLRHLDGLAALIPRTDLADVLIHADLAPGNILVAGGRVIVLDFAMVQRGCSVHDLSRLWVQLDVLRAKPQFRTPVVHRLQQALLTGFDPELTADRPLFRYLVMLHRVNHFASLSLNREPFLARTFSRRVRRLHARWIDREITTTRLASGAGQ